MEGRCRSSTAQPSLLLRRRRMLHLNCVAHRFHRRNQPACLLSIESLMYQRCRRIEGNHHKKEICHIVPAAPSPRCQKRHQGFLRAYLAGQSIDRELSGSASSLLPSQEVVVWIMLQQPSPRQSLVYAVDHSALPSSCHHHGYGNQRYH